MRYLSVPTPIVLFISLLTFLFGCSKDRESVGTLSLARVMIGDTELSLVNGNTNTDLPVDRGITLVFSQAISQATASSGIRLVTEGNNVPLEMNFLAQGTQVVLRPRGNLQPNTRYTIDISSQLQATDGSAFAGSTVSFSTLTADIEVVAIEFAGEEVGSGELLMNAPLDLDISIKLSASVTQNSAQRAVNITGPNATNVQITLEDNNQTIRLASSQPLPYLRRYLLSVSDELVGVGGESFGGFSRTLYTTIDPTPKFPVLSDDELLTLVQRQTFKYFWDFAHPNSGMARERNTAGNTVTSGGSGFGVMALIVGIERNFITRQQGLDRMQTILGFLENSDRFHGAWSHWLNGNTGEALPFSANDNGGDLVETSLLVQGLITFRQYLNPSVPAEKQLIDRINALWEGVDWSWYRRGGQNVLFWHWSADRGWAMNLQISGWNESLITYVLAAASPTHPIPKEVYTNGWTRNGNMRNGNTFEGITLPLGPDFGGPLFFSHYSFLGIDPRGLTDEYNINYWTQNVNHTLINQRYCIRNPRGYVSYNEDSWGLTASDNHQGYSAHSPTNDLGVITPTAALSSFPYTPEESMRALKFFYYTIGDRIWGEYGFYDAFNATEEWYTNSNIAIDQGPIILMIENHRTGLLWDLFMSAPEIRSGLTKLGFNY